MKLRALVILLSISCLTVFANTGMSVLPSLEWQRSELEAKVYDKMNRGVRVILNHDYYFVDVEIATTAPEVPKFNIPLNKSNNKGLTGDDSVESKTVENDKDAKAKKDQEELDKNRKKIKFTNDLPEADYGETVVFSKFGMEAPLIDDFNDFSPSGKILLTMGDDSKAKIEKIKEGFKKEKEALNKEITKLKEATKEKPSFVEQMWKYNTSIDIFKNISAVNILVRLPESIVKEERIRIEKLIQSIKLGVSGVKPKFTFEYSVKMPVQEKETLTPKDFIGALSGVSNIIAIVLGVLLIGLVGNRLISKFFELSSGSQAGGNFTMQNDSNDDEEEGGAGEAIAGGAGGGEGLAGVQSLNGVERFKVFVDNTPQEAILLVKKWLAQDDKHSKAALRALVQQIDNSALKEIFKMLSEPERAAWRDLLNSPLTANELTGANDFISNQIVQSVIVPSLIEDPNTYDLLLKLNSDVVKKVYDEEPYIVALVLNALNDSFVAEVLSTCDDEIVAEILQSSIVIKEEEVREGQAKIQETLSKYIETKSNLPFVEKLFEILPKVTAKVEKSIFDTLKDNVSFDQFLSLSRNYYPAELIDSLPEKFLKEALTQYDLKKRVSMLMGLDESMKNYYLDICAPDGTKARDLISIEFETIERDETLLNKVMNEKEENWKDFVSYVRTLISKDKEFKSEIDSVVHNWVSNKYGDSSNESHLKVA